MLLKSDYNHIICIMEGETKNIRFVLKIYRFVLRLLNISFCGLYKIPYVEKYGYKIMYDNRSIYITLFCTYGEWSICLFVKSGSTKHLIKLAGVLGVNITGNGASLNLEVTEKDLLSKVKQIMLLSDSYEK